MSILKSLNIYDLSINDTGTYPTQYLISCISTLDELNVITPQIIANFVSLSHHKFGCHILDKYMYKCSLNFLVSQIEPIICHNFSIMSKLAFGIKSIKTLLLIENENYYFKKIHYLIHNNLMDIFNEEFGNYLIQTMIETKGLEEYEYISKCIETNFVSLIVGKYSSNVLEKIVIKHKKVSNSLILVS